MTEKMSDIIFNISFTFTEFVIGIFWVCMLYFLAGYLLATLKNSQREVLKDE